jgi:glyoxylate utilization-related uncharacterized protein
MITVLDINEIASASGGSPRVVDFLNSETVGAQLVSGCAYELDPGTSVGPLDGGGAFQLFYVTDGEPVAEFGGDKHHLHAGRGVYCDPDEQCTFENPADTAARFLRFIVANTTST